MNISDLSIEGLTQLEARLTADLEMVKRVKALVVEYQKMGVQGQTIPTAQRLGSVSGGGSRPLVAPEGSSNSGTLQRAARRQTEEELLMEGLAAMPATGFLLADMDRATRRPNWALSKDKIKSWVKSMVRQGKVRVVKVRPGRIGSLYAPNLPVPPTTESETPLSVAEAP